MKRYFIVAESGSDLSQSIIERYNIHVLPMHVAVGGTDYLDGDISIEDLCGYYDKTGKVPMTSAVNPYQYQEVFEKIKTENPDAIIMHVCYSAQTTCTYQNAVIAAEDMSNIYHIDSLNVSAGQAFVVLMTAKLIEEYPDIEPEELISRIRAYANQTRFSFIPGNLDFLRAGGRVSNAQYLGATLLRLKPLIELTDGLLVTKEKYRGSMKSVVQQLIKNYFIKFNIDKNEICLVYVNNIDEDIKADVENHLREVGVKKFTWLRAGCIITSHSGPGGIGIAGLENL